MSQPTAHAPTSTGVPTGRLGIWWFLASEVAIFGGLVMTYVLMRFRHPEWAADAAHTLSAIGAVNTVVLLTSSLTAVLAHHAAGAGQNLRAARLCLLTAALGLVFLGFKAYEYAHEVAHGLTPLTGLFWSFYYLMTGLHALHVVAGMVALVVVGRDASQGRHVQRVEYTALYWHLVDIIWIFLFPLLYLAS